MVYTIGTGASPSFPSIGSGATPSFSTGNIGSGARPTFSAPTTTPSRPAATSVNLGTSHSTGHGGHGNHGHQGHHSSHGHSSSPFLIKGCEKYNGYCQCIAWIFVLLIIIGLAIACIFDPTQENLDNLGSFFNN